jgi:hypothetical protein
VTAPRFDPAARRFASEEAVRFDGQVPRDRFLPNGVGDAAVTIVDSAVIAWFAGVRDGAWDLIRKADTWLSDSIERREVSGDLPEAGLARRLEAYALTRWLVSGEAGAEAFAAAVSAHAAAWTALELHGQLGGQAERRDYLAEILRDCVSAAEPARGLDLFSSLGGRVLANLTPAGSLLHFAYSACRDQGAFRSLTVDARSTAGQTIAAAVTGALQMGNGTAAAGWLRFAFWDTGAASTPAEALQQGLDLILPA